MKSGILALLSGVTLLTGVRHPGWPAAPDRHHQTETATTTDTSTTNPVPLINQPLVPDAAKPGGAAFTLTVNGTGFVSGSVVKWNGSSRTTKFVSSSQLTASILASDISKAGTASVTVVNPSPGGTSNVVFFEIATSSPAIVLATSAFGASAQPSSVATGDFNGDGKLDLVMTNLASANISILLGAGLGAFGPPVNYGLAYGSGDPTSVVVADVNGDGKLDLVVACGGSNDVDIFLGNGDGTFGAPSAYVTNGDDNAVIPSVVAVGDFNQDGKLDLAVANPGGLSVLLGNGDGTFKGFVAYAAGSSPVWVSVGDFNRDGKLDLAVANSGSNNVSVLLGNGDGTFRSPADYVVGIGPSSVSVADFNADGKLDLAVTNLASDNISMLLGYGDGTFRAAVDYGAGSAPAWSAVGDLNGDGKLDLTTANSAVNGGTPSVSVLLGKGDGTFQTVVNYSAGTSPESVVFGDFDRDGKLDMAIADMGSSSSQVFVLSNSLTLMDQVIGTTSAAQPVTLTNYGANTLSITSITITGTDASDFAQTNTCGSSLAAGASCTIDVTFTPQETGKRNATLSIADSASGSPQSVTLTGTATVVEFNPTSLDFGSVFKYQSKTLTTTLTNTGSTALSITGITTTGSTYFSQTNNCGSSLGEGKSCTISVTFAPKSAEKFIGDVSVSDAGGGSPQQVPLSGTGHFNGASADMRSALIAQRSAAVPSFTEANHVGTRLMDLVDSRRDDPFVADGSKRELLVRFWYPASLNEGCKPAEYTSPEVWSHFSELLGIPLPGVRTNSCLDAPIADGAHPVVVFTHGYTGTFTDYTFIFEDLASRGYVVASVDHTYEATAVEFPDGRLAKSLLGSHFSNTWRHDGQALSFAISVRLSDLRFVVDELEHLNADSSSPFSGKLDTTRMAVAGHSLGGVAALLGVEQEARFKVGVVIDGWPDTLKRETRTPVLILACGHERWSDDERRLWDDLRGPRLAVNLRGAEHVTPTDLVWLAKGGIKVGAMGTDKTIGAVRDYIAAFLDANLRGKPLDSTLGRLSSEYPDAVVTTQKQSLRDEATDRSGP